MNEFMNKRLLFGAALSAVAAMSTSAFVADASALLKKWDPDHGGTLDLSEVKKAASARFAHLDGDHDGTHDAAELKTKAGKALVKLI